MSAQSSPSYLTREGLTRLRKELEHLKGPARNELAARLRAAIQQGDLSENADYSKAKEDQAFLEGRIQELEILLKDAIIIDELEKNTDTVNIGNTVTIQEGSEPPEVFYMVGPKEADPGNGRISHESPIGSALMGRKVGDIVPVETPGGVLRFKILRIE